MENITALKAIRHKCLDCVCGQVSEVAKCPATSCPLFPFRFGKGKNKRNLTDEQRKAIGERLRNARKSIEK